MKTKIALTCTILLFVVTVFAQDKNVNSETNKKIEEAKRKAKKFAKKKTEEVQELLRKLLAEKNATKTDAEKAAFQKKIQNLIKTQQKKLPNINWKRKLARFKMLYYPLFRDSHTINGKLVFPKKIPNKPHYLIDINSIRYFGGLDPKAENSKEIILLYEKESDKEGRRIILFLDGHIEVSRIEN